ncbi:hypothetical protein [Pseudomonas lini]|uniref:hypothetical protein n=1 Tax=Pseudomonas lini TaxID=163011 RepID=UPI00345E1762
MSFHNEEFDRKVLPIWDDSAISGKLAENSSVKHFNAEQVSENISEKLILELKRSDDAGVAVELLNVAALEGKSEALALAASRILKESNLPAPVTKMARMILGETEEQPNKSEFYEIKRLRAHLKLRPKNVLAWVDLAREHVIVGNSTQAERAMTIALSLAPSHRWITRVASRLYVHLDLIDKSHYLLMNHPAVRIDPWIASAELAVSQLSGRTSKNVGNAKKILESGLHPKHTAELASALGTLELSAGANKKAKNYFRNSLVDPNRNALAQAKWVEQAHDLKAGVIITTEQMEIAYEAKAWENYINGDIGKALFYSMEWYQSEPYSSKPPMLATYLASLVDQYDYVIEIANQGLRTNSENSTLKLNKAYAEIAKIGIVKGYDVDESTFISWVTLFKDMLKKERSTAGHAAANMGMLCYRMGSIENGRAWYNHAETACKGDGNENYVMCAIHHARESIIAKAPWATEVFEFAKNLLSKNNGSELPSGMFYMKKIEQLRNAPESWSTISGIAKPTTIALPSREIFAFQNTGTEATIKFYLPEFN